MKTVQLNDNIVENPWGEVQRSKRAELMAEIAERLIEWKELESPERVHSWLTRVATLGGDPESSGAVWYYLRIATGDLGQLTASFSELGASRHCTKQAEQQETERAMRVIGRHFPEVAKALSELQRVKRV